MGGVEWDLEGGLRRVLFTDCSWSLDMLDDSTGPSGAGAG